MSRPEARVIVLYEDNTHDSFMRRLVERLRWKPVRFVRCGDSAGVLKSLGREVDGLRERRDQKSLCLVVVIDADEKGLKGRVDQLLRRIADDTSAGARADEERIALVVPALEIENWYVHLCCPDARPVDEERDYKLSLEWKALKKDLATASKRAVDAWAPLPGRADPPSLVAARSELERAS
jgi:hypothetical protein